MVGIWAIPECFFGILEGGGGGIFGNFTTAKSAMIGFLVDPRFRKYPYLGLGRHPAELHRQLVVEPP